MGSFFDWLSDIFDFRIIFLFPLFMLGLASYTVYERDKKALSDKLYLDSVLKSNAELRRVILIDSVRRSVCVESAIKGIKE